jgi:4-hydroxy-4-methyl-2-oxoglutarate aldolase
MPDALPRWNFPRADGRRVAEGRRRCRRITHQEPCMTEPANTSPLSPAELEQLRTFDSATVCNAVEALGVRSPLEGYMGREITCFTPGLGTMVGYAVTATIDNSSPQRNPAAKGVQAFYRALAAAPKPAVVVLQDVSARPSHSCHFGDVVSLVCKRLGAVGIVSNGAFRDLDGIGAVGIHVFAAGRVPARGIYQWMDINVPVTLGGLPVQPGDLIHGDSNGVVTIPPAAAHQVAHAALAVRDKEQATRDYVRSLEFTLEGFLNRPK